MSMTDVLSSDAAQSKLIEFYSTPTPVSLNLIPEVSLRNFIAEGASFWKDYDDETRRLIDQGLLKLRQAGTDMQEAWGFGKTERWAADLTAGTLAFTDPGLEVIAPVQVIGTYLASDIEWQWAWANPSVEPRFAAHAELVREYGLARRIEPFTQPEIICSEEDGWAFMALAAALAGSGVAGAYRGPVNDDFAVFMTFGSPTVVQQNPPTSPRLPDWRLRLKFQIPGSL